MDTILRSAVLAVAAQAAACGATTTEPAPAAAGAKAPFPSVHGVGAWFVVGDDSAPEVMAAIHSALSRAGYVRTTSRTPDSLVIRVSVRRAPLPGGDVAYGIALDVLAKNGKIDDASVSVVSRADRVDAEQMRPLLAALVEHGRLARFVAEREAALRQSAAAAARAREAAEARREAAWTLARSEDCRSEATDEVCAPLRGWLASNAGDARALQAQAVLDATEPRRALLRERAAWAAAEIAECRAPKHSRDCSGAFDFLSRFPNSVHAKEADAAIEQSAAVREKLMQRENAKEDAQKRVDCRAFCATDAGTRRSYRDECVRVAPRAIEACVASSCFGVCMSDPVR